MSEQIIRFYRSVHQPKRWSTNAFYHPDVAYAIGDQIEKYFPRSLLAYEHDSVHISKKGKVYFKRPIFMLETDAEEAYFTFLIACDVFTL